MHASHQFWTNKKPDIPVVLSLILLQNRNKPAVNIPVICINHKNYWQQKQIVPVAMKYLTGVSLTKNNNNTGVDIVNIIKQFALFQNVIISNYL